MHVIDDIPQEVAERNGAILYSYDVAADEFLRDNVIPSGSKHTIVAYRHCIRNIENVLNSDHYCV